MSNSIQRTAPLSAGRRPSALAPERKKPAPAPPPIAPNPPKDGDGSGRPRAGKSTSVYFSNSEHLEYLVELGKTFPKASVSSVMSQLLAAFVKASQASTKDNNRVQLSDVRIYI